MSFSYPLVEYKSLSSSLDIPGSPTKLFGDFDDGGGMNTSADDTEDDESEAGADGRAGGGVVGGV